MAARKSSEHPLLGKRAPAFTLTGDDGKRHALKDFKGQPVVVYFYPKAMTPGCTTEARDFTALDPRFEDAGAVVIGISPDPSERLARFREKEGLSFLLLSDPDHAVARRYHAFGEKKLYGRTFEGILRSTVLIGPDGTVRRAWPKVRVKGHAEAVLEALAEL
jgi:peroxiredoxin Q/BCP